MNTSKWRFSKKSRKLVWLETVPPYYPSLTSVITHTHLSTNEHHTQQIVYEHQQMEIFSHLKKINETCMVGGIASLLPKLDTCTHPHTPVNKWTQHTANSLWTPANGDFFSLLKKSMKLVWLETLPPYHLRLTVKILSSVRFALVLLYPLKLNFSLGQPTKCCEVWGNELINKIISNKKVVFTLNIISSVKHSP